MSAEQLVTAPQGPSNGGVATLDDDDLLDALRAERAARAEAERLYRERDEALGRLQVEMRDLTRLRDNFHSLYREERELRATSDRVAAERIEERDQMESEVAMLRSSVDHLKRSVERLQQRSAAPVAAAEPAEAPAPSAETSAAAPTRIHDLEREAGMLRAHAAELEGAVAQRGSQMAAAAKRIADLEREVAAARSALAASDATGSAESPGELSATARRIHDLEGEVAGLRVELADLSTTRDRILAARDALQQSLIAEQSQRENAERFVSSAEQRVQDAASREQEAARVADTQRHAAERAVQDLAAARATIAVLEQRVHDAEAARAAAEQRTTELDEELAFVRSSVLAGEAAAPAKRGGLLRRREHPHSVGHLETVGTPVVTATVEVAGTAEDVESALHRRLFGEP